MRLFISAAEASGDRLGAALIAGLARRTTVHAEGFGGPHLRAVGVRTWRDASEHSVVGFVEVLAHVPRLLRLLDSWATQALTYRPDAAILIDAPDFHLRLARRLSRAGVPVILFVPPAVWASRPHRVKAYASVVDHILVLFPFEMSAWSGVPVTCVGHPLRDEIPAPIRPHDDGSTVALLPGSRRSEVTRHLPVLRDAAEHLLKAGACDELVVAVAVPHLNAKLTEGLRGLPVRWAEGPSAVRDAVSVARGALVSSGTATLETALLGCPQVVLYRLHPVTHLLARWLMTVDHWALPNILVGRRAVPELIQGAATGPASPCRGRPATTSLTLDTRPSAATSTSRPVVRLRWR
ncbi:MAG: lipid-A-disaccharide synthase, partial [Myxococcota bacterium]